MRPVGVEIVGAIGRRSERRDLVITGVSTDSRTVQPGNLFFALVGTRCDGHDYVAQALEKGAAAVVVSREVEVPPQFKNCVARVKDSLRALGDSSRAYRRRWGGMVIGVTGSNGKTTTREMIHHVLSEQISCKRSPKSFNTNVGVPLTLFQAGRETVAMVVELGTNAPGEIAALADIAEPNIGVITNIGETHLEGLGSVDGVAAAKGELLDALGAKGIAFLNADDPWLVKLAKRHCGKTISFGLTPFADFPAKEFGFDAQGSRFLICDGIPVRLQVPGRHNVQNALVVLAIVQHLGLDIRAAALRMESFRLPESRFQVQRIGDVTVVSDCYNANPASMRAALHTFSLSASRGRKVVVLGDMMELGPKSEELHRNLGSEVARSNVNALWVVGNFSHHVANAARENGLKGRVSCGRELDRVADEVCEFLRPGDALLVKGSRGMQMERLVEKLRTRPLGTL